MNENWSRWHTMLEFFRRLFGKRPAAPGDPYAYVPAPVRRGPKGRSGAAVADIDEENTFKDYPPRKSGS